MCHRNGEKDSYISCFLPELMLYKALYKSLYYPEPVASAGLFTGDLSDIGMALSRGQGLQLAGHPAVPSVLQFRMARGGMALVLLSWRLPNCASHLNCLWACDGVQTYSLFPIDL